MARKYRPNETNVAPLLLMGAGAAVLIYAFARSGSAAPKSSAASPAPAASTPSDPRTAKGKAIADRVAAMLGSWLPAGFNKPLVISFDASGGMLPFEQDPKNAAFVAAGQKLTPAQQEYVFGQWMQFTAPLAQNPAKMAEYSIGPGAPLEFQVTCVGTHAG